MTPVTGVTNLNESAGEWFWDCLDTAIEPAYEEARIDLIRAFVEERENEDMDDDDFRELQDEAEEHANEELEHWDSDCLMLVGDWKLLNETQLDYPRYEHPVYDVDYDGKYGWAGIYRRDNGNLLQVVWSKFAMMSHYCSPCYPDQGDLDTDGDSMLAYCLPPDEWDDSWKDENFHRLVNPEEWREAA